MKDRHGVQLLSPTLHRGLRASNQYDAAKPAVFDCDTFSLEAARQCHERARASASRSSSSPRSASGLFRTESSHATNPPSVRSLDEVYDWGHSSRGTHVSSSFTSSASGRVYPSISKRMSVASSTTSSSLPTAANATTHIVVGGWLQRRRGRMLKRWKAQYCVLKSDSKLCLYANEDTVNGRLEGRFHLLRVTYNDRHQSFQVIGIGSDETPFKEELRPLDDDGWRAWFLALRAFLPPESIHEALERMPELSLLPGIHASLHEDDDDDDEDYGNEIEDMVLRPYRSSVATSDSTSASSHRQQRVHSFASAASASDRKTVLFDPADLLPTSSNNQQDETAAVEAMAWRPPRAASKLYTGGTRRPSTASRTSSSATSSTANDKRRGGGRNPHSLAHGVLAGTVDTRGSSGVDCPMIERDSQNTVAMLERVGSESVVSSRESDSGYSWNRA